MKVCASVCVSVCVHLCVGACLPGHGQSGLCVSLVCLLVSLCGCEAEGTLLLCPLPVLFCTPPPFCSSEVSWWWARWVRRGAGQGGTLHSERPVCAHTFSAASTNTPFLPRVQVGSGDSGNRMTSWGHGHGAIGGGLRAMGEQHTLIPVQESPDPRYPRSSHRVGALQRQMGDLPENHVPLIHPPTLLSYRPGCSPSSVRLPAGQKVT